MLANLVHQDADLPAAMYQLLKAPHLVSSEDRLHRLHEAELMVADRHDWPWMRWPSLLDSDPRLVEVLEAVLTPTDYAGLKPLEADIFLLSRAIRQKEVAFEDVASFFRTPEAILGQLNELRPAFQFELAQLAFVEKRWRIAEHAAVALLMAEPWENTEGFAARADDFLFEILFFSIYRPAMPGYVKDPTSLIARLDHLEGQPYTRRILSQGGIAAIVYRANRLAMQGNFGDALSFYLEARDRTGYRSPVLPQTQTLLNPKALPGSSVREHETWFADHVATEQFFLYEPAGEHALLVACDDTFFDLYGEYFVRIQARQNPGALIHFHLITSRLTKDMVRYQLDNWEASLNIRLNFALERNRVATDVPALIPGLCVCTRYMHLPDYLDLYDSVMISDIDGWPEATTEQQRAFGSADILISSWIWRKNTGNWRLPWGNLSGGYISFSNSAASKSVAVGIAKGLKAVVAQNSYAGWSLFYADQAAVFLTLRMYCEEGRAQVDFLPGRFAQSQEQRFSARYEGKRQHLADRLIELEASTGCS